MASILLKHIYKAYPRSKQEKQKEESNNLSPLFILVLKSLSIAEAGIK